MESPSTVHVVTIWVTSSTLGLEFNPELRVHTALTVGELKKKLMSHCGTEPQWMHLSLLDAGGAGGVAELADDSSSLGTAGVAEGCTVHVTDLNPASAGEAETVEKAVLSDTAAAAREKKFAEFKAAKAKPAVDDEHMADIAAQIALGAACVLPPGARDAIVRFVGKVPELGGGWWVGVEFSSAVGKNDGSVMGCRYFSCPPFSGGFVRPDKVELRGTTSG